MNASYSFQTSRVRICWKHHISILPVYRVAKSFDSLPPGGNCWNSICGRNSCRLHAWNCHPWSWQSRDYGVVLEFYELISLLFCYSLVPTTTQIWHRECEAVSCGCWSGRKPLFSVSLVSPLTWFPFLCPPHHLIACPKFYLQRHLVVPCYMRNLWKMISKFFQSLKLECS